MKKSLFAIAAVTAFAGAAQAQSSVTIYGVLDEGYASIKQTTANATTKTAQGLKDSAWTSNRLGFQGSDPFIKTNYQRIHMRKNLSYFHKINSMGIKSRAHNLLKCLN